MNHTSSLVRERPGLLDRPLPWVIRVCLLVVMGLIPAIYVAKHHDPQTGFTRLIFFGQKFQARALPEIRQLHPATDSESGYDGQFYAQVALDPLLRHPETRTALDNPVTRAQRVFVPALAFVLGTGQAAAVVGIYARINLLFWVLLAGGLVYFLRAVTTRDYLCIAAILLTSGSLFSIQRALTDLPMMTLAFYAMALSGAPAALLIGLTMLTKPTGGLLLLRYVWPIPLRGEEIGRRALHVALALALPVLWEVYLYHVFGSVRQDNHDIGWPFQEWAHCVAVNWHAVMAAHFQQIGNRRWILFGFLAPLSLMFQAVYLAVRRDLASPFWWTGIGFAVLFVCLTASFVEEIAYTRDVLPMTVAFNLMLLRQKGVPFALCFLAGNLGLLYGLTDTLHYNLH
jgi:hypothetical protein